MKTSIDLPDETLAKIKQYNSMHPARKIIVSGVCRLALEAELKSALGIENNDTKRD